MVCIFRLQPWLGLGFADPREGIQFLIATQFGGNHGVHRAKRRFQLADAGTGGCRIVMGDLMPDAFRVGGRQIAIPCFSPHGQQKQDEDGKGMGKVTKHLCSDAKGRKLRSNLAESKQGSREFEFRRLFSGGGEMDYHSHDGKHYNRDYIDFGNYNYGVVSAAAGRVETEMLIASGLYNQKCSVDKSWVYGNDPKNQAMIIQGYRDNKDGKIKTSFKESEAQLMSWELN